MVSRWAGLWCQVFLILEPTLSACILHHWKEIVTPSRYPFSSLPSSSSPPLPFTPFCSSPPACKSHFLPSPSFSFCLQPSPAKIPFNRHPEIWCSTPLAVTARGKWLQRQPHLVGRESRFKPLPWLQGHLGDHMGFHSLLLQIRCGTSSVLSITLLQMWEWW